MLFSMGWETANVHLGNREQIRAVRKHLKAQKPGWLYSSARLMVSRHQARLAGMEESGRGVTTDSWSQGKLC